ncbi:hypothetical protein R1sor_012002 [Riccia sorocarpa]|uniref:NAD(P)-binding domain-containing protein n=1 Tax=Riccia sorocarpa TaxID=122646 RepID=A0ABD3I3G5_9MARC
MEVSVMQTSALRCLQSLQASTSSRRESVYPRKVSAVGKSFGFSKSVSILKRAGDSGLGRRSIRAASSGGTRRDQQKIVARTQKRRARHVKGVTPTKDELMDQLASEEQADADLADIEEEEEGDDADFDEEVQEDDTNPDKLNKYWQSLGSVTTDKQEETKADEVSAPSTDTTDQLPDGDIPGSEEIIENPDNTFTIRFTPEGGAPQKQTNGLAPAAGEAADAAEDTAKGVSEAAGDAAEEAGENLQEAGNAVRENVEEGLDQAGSVAEELTDTAQDTAQSVASSVQETARDSGENLSEAGDAIREGISDVGSQGVRTAQEGANAVGDQLQGAQEETQKNLTEVRDQAGAVGQRAGGVVQKVASEAGKSAEAVGESLTTQVADAAGTVGVIGSEAIRLGEVSLNAVGEAAGLKEQRSPETSSESNQGSDETADKNRKEESKGKADDTDSEKEEEQGEETKGVDSKKEEEQGEESKSVDSKKEEQPEEERKSIDSKKDEQPEEESKSSDSKEESKRVDSKKEEQQGEDEKPEESNPYEGLKVTVAGATGRTGRLIVEELVSKGVPVTALARDPAKARDIDKLLNVEVCLIITPFFRYYSYPYSISLADALVHVYDGCNNDTLSMSHQVAKADLYNYEAVKRAIGDSNVVICAIGASGFPFDPINTYKTEYEGVINLIAAAKNGGKVKKFVLISTIGVSFLQIVPLIFWKKQAELYLQRSGLDYTIVRPGGLKSGVDKSENVLMKGADSQFGGSITRKKVAELCVDAVITPEASEKVVEVVSGGRAGQTPAELFGNI